MLKLLILGVVAATVIGDAAPALAAPGDYVKIDNPTPQAGDFFGADIAVTKKNLVIGAPGDTHGGPAGSGAVFFYAAKDLALQHTLNNQALDSNTSFGASLAISGSSLVFGSPQEDFGPQDTGYAYLASLKTATYQRTFSNPLNSANDYFGFDVAARGSLYAISAIGEDAPTTNSGIVYGFDRTTSGPIQIYVSTSQSPDQEFGHALAFVGNTLAIGAPGQQISTDTTAGLVHLYNARTSAFISLLVPQTSTAGERFGDALAGSKKQLAVGAPGDTTPGTVYVFDVKNPTAPPLVINNPNPTNGDEFGASVCFSSKYIVVGAPGEDFGGVDSGSVYVFSAADGTLVQTIHNPEGSPGDQFGRSVASDGKVLYIGCPTNQVAGVPAGSVFKVERVP